MISFWPHLSLIYMIISMFACFSSIVCFALFNNAHYIYI